MRRRPALLAALLTVLGMVGPFVPSPREGSGEARAATPDIHSPTRPQPDLQRPAPTPTPSAAEEDPHVAFRLAENTFRYQDYARAVELLEPLLYPEVLLEEAEEIRAREFLGASLWWLKDYDRAEAEFSALLTRRSDYHLDTFYHPASLIAFFEGVREKLVRMKVIVRDDAPDAGAAPQTTPILRERIVTERSLALAFVPFGVGQFHNGQTAKGIVFLSVETLALAMNIASYFVIDFLRNDNGFIASENIDRARTFEVVLYTSLGVFAATAVGGIIDALVFFEPRSETVHELPQESEGTETSLRLLPDVGPDRIGLDFELRF